MLRSCWSPLKSTIISITTGVGPRSTEKPAYLLGEFGSSLASTRPIGTEDVPLVSCPQVAELVEPQVHAVLPLLRSASLPSGLLRAVTTAALDAHGRCPLPAEWQAVTEATVPQKTLKKALRAAQSWAGRLTEAMRKVGLESEKGRDLWKDCEALVADTEPALGAAVTEMCDEQVRSGGGGGAAEPE